MTDYALWTLGWLDGLVEKSSFPFHRSDYLCCEFVNAAITRFFVANVSFTRFLVENVVMTRFFGVEFYAEFLAEILHLFKKYNNLIKVAVRE